MGHRALDVHSEMNRDCHCEEAEPGEALVCLVVNPYFIPSVLQKEPTASRKLDERPNH